jgi:hypothetical protein
MDSSLERRDEKVKLGIKESVDFSFNKFSILSLFFFRRDYSSFTLFGCQKRKVLSQKKTKQSHCKTRSELSIDACKTLRI